MPLDFDAKSRAYRRLGWRKPSGPGCLTFRLPVVRVRLGRKIETVNDIWKISLTSVFPKVGRVSPRSYKPVEIGALAQTKPETLVAEAGTETCHKRLCFGERFCLHPKPRPYGSCAPGAAAPHRQSGRQRASSRSGAIVCRGGSVMGAPARVAIRSNKQQTPLKKDAGHNARRSMADARVGSYFQRGTGRNVILATWEDQASSLPLERSMRAAGKPHNPATPHVCHAGSATALGSKRAQ